jgi:hypothetical protein
MSQESAIYFSYDTILSVWQISSLFRLVRIEIIDKKDFGSNVKKWELYFSHILINLIFPSNLSCLWERIISKIIISDSTKGNDGFIVKLYEVDLPLTINCAVNDDALGLIRLESNYSKIGSLYKYKDELGWGLIHHASYSNSLKIIDLLIKNNISVNDKSNSSEITPLHIAALNQNYNLIEKLLQHGANIFSLDIQSNIPFQYLLNRSVANGKEYYLEYPVQKYLPQVLIVYLLKCNSPIQNLLGYSKTKTLSNFIKISNLLIDSLRFFPNSNMVNEILKLIINNLHICI